MYIIHMLYLQNCWTYLVKDIIQEAEIYISGGKVEQECGVLDLLPELVAGLHVAEDLMEQGHTEGQASGVFFALQDAYACVKVVWKEGSNALKKSNNVHFW